MVWTQKERGDFHRPVSEMALPQAVSAAPQAEIIQEPACNSTEGVIMQRVTVPAVFFFICFVCKMNG